VRIVIWHGDPKDLGIMAEERWERALEEAANRRLLAGCGQRGTRSGVVRRAQVVLEHLFYIVIRKRVLPPPAEVEDECISDAELIRLLSLLAPDGEVLHVERVRRMPRSEEERCVSSGRSRQAPTA
jgi:hypothetical protein